MGQIDEHKIKRFENIQRGAGFDSNRTYPLLFQHLGYRKHICEQLIREKDEANIKNLSEMYDIVNREIKLIIAIE